MADARTRARRKGESGNPEGLSFREAEGFPRPLRRRSGRARFATLKQATRAWNRKDRMGADASRADKAHGRRPAAPVAIERRHVNEKDLVRFWLQVGMTPVRSRHGVGMPKPASRNQCAARRSSSADIACREPSIERLRGRSRRGSRIYSKRQQRAPFKASPAGFEPAEEAKAPPRKGVQGETCGGVAGLPLPLRKSARYEG